MKKCCPGLPLVLVVIFGVVAFLYFEHSFKAISKIDFESSPFYEILHDQNLKMFEPKEASYELCLYSSYGFDWALFFQKKLAQRQSPILAIDFYQVAFVNEDLVSNLRVSSENMLLLIHEFGIKKLPFCSTIEQNAEATNIYEKPKDFGIYKLLNFKKDKENP